MILQDQVAEKYNYQIWHARNIHRQKHNKTYIQETNLQLKLSNNNAKNTNSTPYMSNRVGTFLLTFWNRHHH